MIVGWYHEYYFDVNHFHFLLNKAKNTANQQNQKLKTSSFT